MRIVIAKEAFNRKISLLTSKSKIEHRKKLIMCYVCKDISLTVNIGKTKYMEAESRRGVMINEHIRMDSNSYEKVKSFKCVGPFIEKSKFYSGGNKM